MPYLSAYASKSRNGSKLYLIVINRSQVDDIRATIQLRSSTPLRATIRKLGGRGYTLSSHNADDPQNVTLRESSLVVSGTDLVYTFEPLSITGFEFQGQTP